MNKRMTKHITSALIMAGFSGIAGAAGFALQNQSGSGNGNAFAGAAASADDASVIYFNPAGMVYLQQGHSISLSGTILSRSIKFKNTGTTNVGLNGAGNTADGGEAGATAFLPHGYWAWALNKDVRFGIGIGPTFGNKSEYNENFIGRNAGYFADISHININPSVAFRVNEMVSLGFGLDFTRASVRFEQGIPTVNGSTNHLGIESDPEWGVGANLGAMFQISESMRVGVTYRSAISFDVKGEQTVASPVAGLAGNSIRNQDVRADGYKSPASASIATYQKLSDQWEMLGDLTWTNWSTFKELVLESEDGVPGNPLFAAGHKITSLPYNLKDSWRIGLGANYQYNDEWKFRFGMAYDHSPVTKPVDRTMTLPDSDRTWLSFGARYKLDKQSSLDFAYSHLFFKEARTDRAVTVYSPVGNATQTVQRVRGEWNNNSADIASLQYNYNF